VLAAARAVWGSEAAIVVAPRVVRICLLETMAKASANSCWVT
jgi:hypothetical protein